MVHQGLKEQNPKYMHLGFVSCPFQPKKPQVMQRYSSDQVTPSACEEEALTAKAATWILRCPALRKQWSGRKQRSVWVSFLWFSFFFLILGNILPGIPHLRELRDKNEHTQVINSTLKRCKLLRINLHEYRSTRTNMKKGAIPGELN